MGEYVVIAGHPTWVDDGDGAGDPVLVLHGGLSESDSIVGMLEPLAARHRMMAFDRRGHGRTADTDAPFHYDDMAREAVDVLTDVVGGPSHLVGYSDGGIVALLVAIARPDLVRTVVVIGTNFHHDGLVEGAFDDLTPDSPDYQMLRQTYAERSPDGADHFPVVFEKTLTMFSSEPTMTPADLATIAAPVLVVAGDDDLVTLGHTCTLYESLPHGQLAIAPGASHLLPHEQPELLNRLVADFLEKDGRVETLMPLRRH